jgi:hypothetical protein
MNSSPAGVAEVARFAHDRRCESVVRERCYIVELDVLRHGNATLPGERLSRAAAVEAESLDRRARTVVDDHDTHAAVGVRPPVEPVKARTRIGCLTASITPGGRGCGHPKREHPHGRGCPIYGREVAFSLVGHAAHLDDEQTRVIEGVEVFRRMQAADRCIRIRRDAGRLGRSRGRRGELGMSRAGRCQAGGGDAMDPFRHEGASFVSC